MSTFLRAIDYSLNFEHTGVGIPQRFFYFQWVLKSSFLYKKRTIHSEARASTNRCSSAKMQQTTHDRKNFLPTVKHGVASLGGFFFFFSVQLELGP